MFDDTIVAPATPPGEGGIGIVRLSGEGAVAHLDRVFTGPVAAAGMASHRLYLGRLTAADGRLVDEVLAVVMRAPRSYTGEDVVEVHCHGGRQVLKNVLDLFLADGARLAGPGEFTQRAFLNGRLDLTQAEAVIDLIRARSERAGQVALGQLEGRLSQHLQGFTEPLKEALVFLEAHIDFPEEEVGDVDLPPVVERIDALQGEIEGLVESFDAGRLLREGLNLLILGRPNVGKSSLMNALLGEARAIVTEIAGTTRDTLEEQMVLGGFPVRLVDTAGVRETVDPIELEGVRRAREKAAQADLVLLVVDGSVPLTNEDRMAMALCDPQRALVVCNKADRGRVVADGDLAGFAACVPIAAKTGDGMQELQDAVIALFSSDSGVDVADDVIITERRHKEALFAAAAALDRFQQAADERMPLECLALEIRGALDALGQITGETTPDEILNEIFGRFCIGK